MILSYFPFILNLNHMQPLLHGLGWYLGLDHFLLTGVVVPQDCWFCSVALHDLLCLKFFAILISQFVLFLWILEDKFILIPIIWPFFSFSFLTWTHSDDKITFHLILRYLVMGPGSCANRSSSYLWNCLYLILQMHCSLV